MGRQLKNEWGVDMAYTRTHVVFTLLIEQHDGRAPGVDGEVELVTCDACGAVVLAGADSLETVWKHDLWHDQLAGRDDE